MISFFMAHYTLFLVMYGASLFGITAGVLGCFALLRQQSLLGDAISHAALPGIVAMFLLTHSKEPWLLLIGGVVAGIGGVWCMNIVVAHTKLKKDAILGIILSVFFGLGLVLMTVAQKIPVGSQAVLNKFLFGSVATLLPVDIVIIQAISLFIFLVLFLLWKECCAYVYDPLFIQSVGYSACVIECVLTGLLVLTIVVGLQAVGVVLMSTLLIAPAAAARQWTVRLSSMMILAGFFGCISCVAGVYVSACVDHIPTGPSIVIIATMIVLFSLLFSPVRRIV
jgi:manganese/zinc/iron transport system permease protein